MSGGLIQFLVYWVPTILFILIILSALLFGLIRGFRKSLILTINAVVAALICIITYLVLVNNAQTDIDMLNLINSITESTGLGTLQGILGVSEECKSVTECLIDYIPRNMAYGEGVQLVVLENGAYLAALVNLIYHLIVALIMSLVYAPLIFVFYLIYLIFYPERRYKKKINKKC